MLTAFVPQERGDWNNYVCPAQKHGLVSMCTDSARYSLFQYGLNTGGPGVMSVGWIIISFFSMSGAKNKQTRLFRYLPSELRYCSAIRGFGHG